MNKHLLATLQLMHTYCRPAGSGTEEAFRNTFLMTLPGAWLDVYGNIHVHIGSDPHPVLWSAHTDTVHRDDGRQTVHYSQATGMLALSKRSKSHGRNCLGADDTVGCFVLREMILAGKAGYYLFHYGEERGGIGSGDLARYCSDWLKQFKYAIAIDRRGTCDVISHQWSGRCASDTFVTALAAALGPRYSAAHGSFTDTANYMDDIPECSNISAGYYHEHTSSEVVDCAYVLWLLDKLLTIDVSTLPVERDPAAIDDESWGYSYNSWDNVNGWGISNTYASANVQHDAEPVIPEVASLSLCRFCGEPWDHDLAECPICGQPAEDDLNDHPPYLDPDWERVQRALLRAEALDSVKGVKVCDINVRPFKRNQS